VFLPISVVLGLFPVACPFHAIPEYSIKTTRFWPQFHRFHLKINPEFYNRTVWQQSRRLTGSTNRTAAFSISLLQVHSTKIPGIPLEFARNSTDSAKNCVILATSFPFITLDDNPPFEVKIAKTYVQIIHHDGARVVHLGRLVAIGMELYRERWPGFYHHSASLDRQCFRHRFGAGHLLQQRIC
jgi:hypothetical protein